MKAQIIKKFGDASELTMIDMDIPQPAKNQVLVRVHSISVNPIDTKIRAGLLAGDLPMLLHKDFAGEVVELGEGVDAFSIGDAVYGCCGLWGGGTGTSAEYTLVDYRLMAHAPKKIPLQDCAVIPLVALTAMYAMERLDIRKNDTVCVQSATGGVGYMALQIALAKKARVIGITSNETKAELIRDAGAIALNRSTDDPLAYAQQQGGFPKIFNTVGTQSLDDAFQLAAPYGKIVGIAGRSDHNLGLMHAKNLTLSFVFLSTIMADPKYRHTVGNMLKKIAKLVARNKIKPLIYEQRFTLETLEDAHICLEQGTHQGKKIVVDIL